MNEKTKELLNRCAQAGITRVAIERKHKSVPSSMKWTLGESGCVFTAEPESVRRKREASTYHWPSIWDIARDVGVYGGAGNEDQACITGGLDAGVYHLVNGEWQEVKS